MFELITKTDGPSGWLGYNWPIGLLFFALGAGASILIQAGLAFIGISDPFVPSWGVIIRNAYASGQMDTLWWWSLPPGFLISLTVLSLFMFGRGYESIASAQDEGDEALVHAS